MKHTNKIVIYTAGGMELVSMEDARQWRQAAEDFFINDERVLFLHPTRRTHSFRPEEMRRIFDLDMMDLKHCDMVLANLDNPKLAKHGTAMEVFHASYHLRKPVVAFKASRENIHPFFESLVTEWRSTVLKACETIRDQYL